MSKIIDKDARKFLDAALRFIRVKGGGAVVIGDIQVLHWPEDNEHVYRLSVKFTGRPPVYALNGFEKTIAAEEES